MENEETISDDKIIDQQINYDVSQLFWKLKSNFECLNGCWLKIE